MNGLPVYLMTGADKLTFYRRIQAGDVPPSIAVALPLKLLSGVIYATITLLFLRRHHDMVKASYSSVERVNLRMAAVALRGSSGHLGDSGSVERAGIHGHSRRLDSATMSSRCRWP